MNAFTYLLLTAADEDGTPPKENRAAAPRESSGENFVTFVLGVALLVGVGGIIIKLFDIRFERPAPTPTAHYKKVAPASLPGPRREEFEQFYQ